jgi:hypothetical protein
LLIFFEYYFICDKGDNVDVVVPPLAESIEDGTLAKFLKSMLTNSIYILFTVTCYL